MGLLWGRSTRKSSEDVPAADATKVVENLEFTVATKDIGNADDKLARYEALVAAFRRGCTDFNPNICSHERNIIRDQSYTEKQYFYGGRSALKACIDALFACNHDIPRRVLDFPCGHGRGARFLRAAFPDAALHVSDIDETGVRFCQEQFGAIGFSSKVDIEAIEFPDNLDLIWCGSLVTHLSEDRTRTLLRKLRNALSDRGVLLFTTHGRAYLRYLSTTTQLMKPGEWENVVSGYYETGYGYEVYSVDEFRDIDYGFSIISPNWIYKNIIWKDDGVTLISYSEKGWHDHQDLYVVQKRDLSSWYNIEFL